MSFSRKISSRLFEEAESRRKIRQVPLHIRNLYRNMKYGEFSSSSGRNSNNSSYFFGIIVLLSLATVGVTEQKESFKTSSLFYLCLPTSGIIFGYSLIFNNMESINSKLFLTGDMCKIFFTRFLKSAQKNIAKIEEFYLNMKNISVLIDQLVFFSLCEQAMFLHQPLMGLYTLMFFTVIAFCVAYVKELVEKDDWSMYVTIAQCSNVRHLALSTTKIVLEWTKAITFIITVVFMLLIVGLENGLENYQPTIPYLIVTSTYFLISDKIFVELILKFLDNRKFTCFENMESLYLPIILKGFQIVISGIFTVICCLIGYYRLSILSSITNVRLRFKELENYHWKILKKQLMTLAGYRYANKEDIVRHDDVCAICLNVMKTARITPCKHFFHADCLLKSLSSMAILLCPICKQKLP